MVTSLPRQSTSLTQQAEASRAAAKVLVSFPPDSRRLALDLIAQELTTQQAQIFGCQPAGSGASPRLWSRRKN
ncbi:MAG: hypothetical protein HC818_01890 [Synechococcaceae cyanobacterium RM1_1_27]|nr:hypothetical protein [Synechococcaceae cyanobacterium RM1_1_27]